MPSFESEEEASPLLNTLKNAENCRYTGIYKFFEDSEQIGVVVMHDGRVAWATSSRQIENFGSFLETIGMISKERQKEIIDQFKTLGKTRELGEVLEETGQISRETLRKCLKKQIQSALDSLIGTEKAIIRSTECEININTDLLFSLDEILPSISKSVQSTNEFTFATTDKSNSENFNDTNGLRAVLKNLSSLSGYQYSFIYDTNAKILASHRSESFPGNFEELMAFSIPCIISTNRIFKESNTGKIEFVLLEHDKGSLVAQWLNLENNFFVAASFDKNGKPGVVKHKISEMIPAILHIAESH